jgi:hypothetical protein
MWLANITHVDQVLHRLSKHKIFLKQSKCAFGIFEGGCLGRIVGKDGVRVDPNKIESMQIWPLPKTLKSMCGFVGLIGYYHNLVLKNRKILAPLTTLLRKNAFN